MKRNTLVGPQLQTDRSGSNLDLKRALWLLLPVVLGATIATQVLANTLRYHPSLGANLYHFYPPWSYFVWSNLWSHTNPAIFAQAFGIGAISALASFLLLVLVVGFSRGFRVNPFLHGSARWADRRDIKAAGLLGNDGVYVGAWTDKAGKTHYLRHAGPEHVLCYAPTRSGKGVGLIVPTLLSWRQSVCVTDLNRSFATGLDRSQPRRINA